MSRPVTSSRHPSNCQGCGTITFDNPLLSKIFRLTHFLKTPRITCVIAAVT